MFYSQCFFLSLLSLLFCSSNAASQPHIILIVADDYGWNDIGYHQVLGETTNALINTPFIDSLALSGVRLESHYAQPLCSPTRGALLTGRLPSHTGVGPNVIKPDMPYAMPGNETLLPEVLKAAGYATHMVGKWHLGFCDERYTPTFRGFDTFMGYFNGAEGYFSHWRPESGYMGFDLRNGSTPNELSPVVDHHHYYGHYSSQLFGAEAARIIENHASTYNNTDTPMFLYFPLQSVHAPLECPPDYMYPYADNITDTKRRILAGMINGMDQAVETVISALKKTGMWENSVIVFLSDNGGPTSQAASNYPLRGNKTSNFEGGVRVNAFVSGPGANIDSSLIGTECNALFHVTDWLPSIAHAASATVDTNEPLDGIDQWDTIISGGDGERTTIVHNMPASGLSHGALRYKQWKLIIESDVTGSSAWEQTPTSPPPGFEPVVADIPPEPYNGMWLFDIENDPYETTNLAESNADTLQMMIEMFQELQVGAVEDISSTVSSDPTCDPSLNEERAWAPWADQPGSQCVYK